ncbi:hypothetical protein Afil01_06180 [Actinorhabdospora filicis]|uniref:DUF6879 domain-containing protein n=1 Tax=Actinorhabdospora filicis TaxID=1785913 RepID=A0A9W6SHX4_9ACTN|nr:DUF6879 family protein [Actinorhabdospora filicis]GLZ75811.1 hypothetical protein Afil01_06180 [Actinorhabdospora filicis]
MTAPDPPAIAKQRSNILRKVLVTGVIGALGFGLTELVLPNGPWSWLSSVFLGSVAFVTQFLVDVERRLDSVERTYQKESSATRSLIHSDFSKINEAAKLSREMDGSGLPIDDIVRLIRSATHITPIVPQLVLDLARTEIARVSAILEDLARGGDVSYEGEDRDWLISLTRLAHHSIDAVSLDTVDVGTEHFLSSHIGRLYLTEQARSVRRGVRVRRVHVLNPLDPNPQALDQVTREQEQLGIEVRVLPPERRPRSTKALVDFIVFDGTLSYETTPASEQTEATPVIVDTRLVPDEQRVARRRQMFADLWDAAIPLGKAPLG